MNKKWIFRILTALVTLFIFSNSLKSAQASSQDSEILVELFTWFLGLFGKSADYELMQNIVRKMAHFAEFTLQGVLLCRCFEGRFRDKLIYVLFFGLFTACTDEFIQLFFEGRGSQIKDVFIDFSGTVCGALFWGMVRHIRRKQI